jgi:NADH-quinone oxidoreductase subunit N
LSAPLIWIILPGCIGAVLFLLRRWSRLVDTLGIITALSLALLAWRAPIGQPILLGPWAWLPPLEISDSLAVLGRQLLLPDPIRPALTLIYLSAAIWFIGARAARTERLFVPIGLMIAALFTAALAVEPFLYAALLIETAALISVPILSPPGKQVPNGVLRFLTFQTLGMPFVLLAGWTVSAMQVNPSDPSLAVRAAILLSLGFAMLMAVFPFHSWIPMLSEEAHPYPSAFVFFAILFFATLIGFNLAARFDWLQSLPAVIPYIRLVGVATIVVAGVWAAFQRHLGRVMGYAVAFSIGITLLVLSLALGAGGISPADQPPTTIQPGIETGRLLLGDYFANILPTGLTLALWALSLSILRSHAGGLRFRQAQGLARRLPFATLGVCVANLSLAGLPLLAGFPQRFALLTELARQSPSYTVVVLLGMGGLITAALRSLAVLVMAPENQPWEISEHRWQIVLIVAGSLALLLVGLFPQVFLPSPELMGSIYSSGK